MTTKVRAAKSERRHDQNCHNFSETSLHTIPAALSQVFSPNPTFTFFWLSECFRLSSRRNRFTSRVIRSTISVRNLVDCESACISARSFNCRSLAFKPSARDRNCDLSTFDLRDLGRDDLVGDLGYDLFERRSSSFCNPQIGGGSVDVAVGGGVSTLSKSTCLHFPSHGTVKRLYYTQALFYRVRSFLD